MVTVEHGELQVVVPVGLLLAEAREVTVSVDRPGDDPLPIRLLLIPARRNAAPSLIAVDESMSVPNASPPGIAWPMRAADDSYGDPEYGGGD